MGNISFAERMRLARLEKGLTQAELATKVGVVQSTVHNWENSKAFPDTYEKSRIRKILGLDGKNVHARNKQAESDDNFDTNPSPSDFGSWLKRTRDKRGLSVQDLVASSGVAITTIYRIERGQCPYPRKETIQRLKKALGDEFSSVKKKRRDKRTESDEDKVAAPLHKEEWDLQGRDEHRKVEKLLLELGKLRGYFVVTNKEIGARVRPDVAWFTLDPDVHPRASASHVFEIELGGSQPITKSLASLKHAHDLWSKADLFMIVPRAKVSSVNARIPGSFHEIARALKILEIEGLQGCDHYTLATKIGLEL